MKISKVTPLENYILHVVFDNQVAKIYDVKPLFDKWQVFNDLKKNNLFTVVRVDSGGHGIVWNDDIDLSKYEIWENGYQTIN